MSNTRFTAKRVDPTLALVLLRDRESVPVTRVPAKRSKRANVPSNKVLVRK